MSKAPLATKQKPRISPVASLPPRKRNSISSAPMSISPFPDSEPVVTSPSAAPSQLSYPPNPTPSISTEILSSPSTNAVTSTAVVNPQQIQHINRPTVQKNVPAFLNKLFNMVDDPSSNDLIRWGDDGLSFLVNKHQEFAKEVLPRFFKHNNFASFVRQLNMYGFHKVPHLQQGVLQATEGTEQWEFSNPHFQRNQPDLLVLVTRKRGANGADDIRLDIPPGLLGVNGIQGMDLSVLLNEIAAIKKHQLAISSDLKNIQRDNQIFWQETLAARERHERHQETIDKILRFLASVFSQDRKRQIVPRKRRLLLGASDPKFDGSGNGDPALTGKEEVEEEIEMRKEGNNTRQGNPALEIGTSDQPHTNGTSVNLNDLGNSNGSDGTSEDADIYEDFGILSSKVPTNDAITKRQTSSTDSANANPYSFLTLESLQNMIAEAAKSNTTSAPISAPPNTSNGAIPSTVPSTADLSLINLDMNAIPQFPLPSTVPPLPTHLVPTSRREPRIDLVQHTQNIANVAKSADVISEEMETLHANMESLANQLGYIGADQLADANFDQSTLNYITDGDNWPLGDPASSNLGFPEDVDMDQFLREFDNQQPSSPVLTTNSSASTSSHPPYKHSVSLEEPPSKKSKVSDETEEEIF